MVGSRLRNGQTNYSGMCPYFVRRIIKIAHLKAGCRISLAIEKEKGHQLESSDDVRSTSYE